jgi:glutamyl-Q tRNA(Asp) synthetase
MWTTRFAPSPTGALHLGHAWSAIQAHDAARENDGKFLLRIEDIDGTRSRPEHVAGILDDLEWLGIGWDGPVVFQSQRLALYEAALERLKAEGLVYPCFCTRADIAREVAASLSAPHGPDGALYPGICKGLSEAERVRRVREEPHCWRLDVGVSLSKVSAVTPDLFRGPTGGSGIQRGSMDSDGVGWTPEQVRGDGKGVNSPLAWHDCNAGWIRADLALHGDVVLARKDAPASYHLAVTVDDAAQGVTNVIRGRDLFAATHVHRLLQALLDLPTPDYCHHALLTDAEGNRLAKRNGAPTLASLRASGMPGAELAQMLREGRLPVGFAVTKD